MFAHQTLDPVWTQIPVWIRIGIEPKMLDQDRYAFQMNMDRNTVGAPINICTINKKFVIFFMKTLPGRSITGAILAWSHSFSTGHKVKNMSQLISSSTWKRRILVWKLHRFYLGFPIQDVKYSIVSRHHSKGLVNFYVLYMALLISKLFCKNS
jgi:hypothetical protein